MYLGWANVSQIYNNLLYILMFAMVLDLNHLSLTFEYIHIFCTICAVFANFSPYILNFNYIDEYAGVLSVNFAEVSKIFVLILDVLMTFISSRNSLHPPAYKIWEWRYVSLIFAIQPVMSILYINSSGQKKFLVPGTPTGGLSAHGFLPPY